jgi:CheY-like chemotaxis protein
MPAIPDLPPLAILAADDVPQNLELLQLALQRYGHQVTAVQDGQAAEAGTQRFDVILMDVQMSGTDGLTATRKIRAIEAQRASTPTPIIALTASVWRKTAARRAMPAWTALPAAKQAAGRNGGLARLRPRARHRQPRQQLARHRLRTRHPAVGHRQVHADAMHRYLSTPETAPGRLAPDPQRRSDRRRHWPTGCAGRPATWLKLSGLAGPDRIGVAQPGCRRGLASGRRTAARACAGPRCHAMAPAPTARTVSEPAPSAGDLPALATALAESLRRGELDDVQLATVRCVRTAGQTQLQALERAVDDFDFDTAIALLDELSRTASAPREPAMNVPDHRPKLLIVDDEPANLQMLRHVCRRLPAVLRPRRRARARAKPQIPAWWT